MSYKEWKEEYSKGKFRVKERDLEVAWNAAIDEAVEVVLSTGRHKDPTEISSKLKELKDDS